TVQAEVAARMTARPNDMSLLALSVQLFGEPKIVMRLDRSAFYPQPEVESAVVAITPHRQPLYADLRTLFTLARAGFGQRRKQLRNTLSGNLGLSPQRAEVLLQASGVDPTRRAETLSVGEWIALSEQYKAMKEVHVQPARAR
ncbi:MAG: rRNA adenine N-6-methyltransferase family protein, partial [Anaerolineae bacterium]|nr:hypothetical protein [Thermoflexales bacterium]MDW8407588.1 rRNA adenine N-6-methyltransferase family protein [Anaerolineae bacterium]